MKTPIELCISVLSPAFHWDLLFLHSMKRLKVLGLLLILTNVAGAQGFKEKQFDKMVDNLLSHSVPEVKAKNSKYDSSIVYLDAREIDEYNTSKIENAQWVGFDNFDISKVNSLKKDQTIIVYCSIGYRSEKIAEKLQANGFTDVTNMVGGIFQWVNYNKVVFDPSNHKTTNVHAFDKEWGKWLDDGLVEKVYR